MIDGVTVVETISQTVTSPSCSWLIVVCLLALSAAVFSEVWTHFKNKRVVEGISTSFVIVVSICLCIYTLFGNSFTRNETLYIVEVSENVSLKDFYENYEIVSIDGDLYTVKLLSD